MRYGQAKTMRSFRAFQSLMQEQGFEVPRRLGELTPDSPAYQYYSAFASTYEGYCGEGFERTFTSGEGWFTTGSHAEVRFAQSLQQFARTANLNALGRSVRAWAKGYARFLDGGLGCPEGSPVRLRALLGVRYPELVQEVRAAGREEEAAILEMIQVDLEAIENAEHLEMFLDLARLLDDPEREQRGRLLLQILAVNSGHQLSLPPRFAGLVAVAARGGGDPALHALLALADREGGRDPALTFFFALPPDEGLPIDPLMAELIGAVANAPSINPVLVELAEITAMLINDPRRRASALRYVEILSNEVAVRLTEEVDSVEAFKQRLQGLKKRGGGGSGGDEGGGTSGAGPGAGGAPNGVSGGEGSQLRSRFAGFDDRVDAARSVWGEAFPILDASAVGEGVFLDGAGVPGAVGLPGVANEPPLARSPRVSGR